jgi:alginate O-acetyltransferase complex protein AlgI
MYPQLVAGPIVRYGTVAEQLRTRPHSLAGFVAGFTRFNFGFAKKILLANPMGRLADLAFEAGSPGAPVAWAGLLAYALQIYFDFSAYSDMAVGLGRMMGFRFPENFNSPYQSTSLTEFWRRWHISLSTFLRDYLYIPLGGNRTGSVRTYLNLLLVMLIGGLWHGAQWTFVIWGGLHGIVLALERLGKNVTKVSPPRWIGWTATTLVVLSGWVFFRSPDLSTALGYLGSLFGHGELPGNREVLEAVFFTPLNLAQLSTCAVVAWFFPNTGRFLRKLTPWKTGLGIALLLASVRVMGLQGFNPFLYFQF